MFRIVLILLTLCIVPAHAQEGVDPRAKVFDYFLERASTGNMKAQYIVGTKYQAGIGIRKNTEKAHEWYKKAAAQGHREAKTKLANWGKPGSSQKPSAQKTGKPKQSVNRPLTSAALSRPVSKPASKAVSSGPIDIIRTIMEGKWMQDQSPSVHLPSKNVDCVITSDSEISCFSKKLERHLGKWSVVYTTKATLSNFNNRNGKFRISYRYNAIKTKRGSGASSDGLTHMADMTDKKGWQPKQTLDCVAKSKASLICKNANKRTFRFKKW